MNSILESLATTVGDAADLESLMRPLLELMETVTGLESTYLTTIDLRRGVQHVLFARNTRSMTIPEGLDVPWSDTLCKRALDENCAYTDNVAECWGDSEAAQALGIRTYLSQPVRTLDGEVYGTLCAASSARVSIPPETLRIVDLFARLVSFQVERERQLERLRTTNQELSVHAMIDPLTGVANRRGLMNRLERTLERARREHQSVMVAFVDLDGFKTINDHHGHDAGDAFLREMAQKLTQTVRANEFVGRYGGDEFVIVAGAGDAEPFSRRIETATMGRFVAKNIAFEYAGASVGVAVASGEDCDAESLLSRADAAMYAAKLARKARAGIPVTRH
jgi:diguanylate cyclase